MRPLLYLAFVGALALLLQGCHPEAPPASPSPRPTPTPLVPSPLFEDATASAGIGFRNAIVGPSPCNILQSIGTGAAFLDVDNDGNLDLLLIGPQPALYQGDGKGHFVDRTAAWLPIPEAHYLGCAVGDIDNDGFVDLYLSGYRTGRLLRNRRGQGFRDITPQSGLNSQPWGTSATFLDFNGDGLLDLFVGNYVDFSPETQPQLCKTNTVLTACGPTQYAPKRGALFQNRGRGQFVEVTQRFGLDRAPGRTLGVAVAPWGEKKLALAVANDETPGSLHLFDKERQTDIAVESGTALNAHGQVYAGMGIDWGDYDGDGVLDLAVAAYQNQAKLVFKRENAIFVQQDVEKIGLSSSISSITFGLKWLDFDNDGWLDLLLVNGHVQDNAEVVNSLVPGGGKGFRQEIIPYQSVRGSHFVDRHDGLVKGAERLLVGRGLAVGDYDNDGRLDAVVVDATGAPLLLHNIVERPGHWVSLKLVGVRSNRSGFGARVWANVSGRKLLRHCHTDGSYLSASDSRVHLGTGTATELEVTVEWPAGRKEHFTVPADKTTLLKEGTGRP